MNGWLDSQDVAAILNVSPRTVQRWATERKLPHIRIGRMVRFTQEQVAEIRDAYTIEPAKHIEVCQPNPEYRPHRAVVVPMKRTAGM